ncbi:MAG TPA: hypothetical protein VNM22_21430, partial [Candidatus Limnocylindrales bacterium]|nr:hypothetical protein [Candidatus Limnocylindrales bacterium]
MLSFRIRNFPLIGIILIGVIFINLSALEAEEKMPTGDPSIIPPGAKLEKLFEGGCVLTEGVAAGPDGMIYFSDITFTFRC